MTPHRLQARPMPLSLVAPETGEISQPAPEQPVDDVDGVPVAGVLVLTILGTAGAVILVLWLSLFHWAGSTGGINAYRAIGDLWK